MKKIRLTKKVKAYLKAANTALEANDIIMTRLAAYVTRVAEVHPETMKVQVNALMADLNLTARQLAEQH